MLKFLKLKDLEIQFVVPAHHLATILNMVATLQSPGSKLQMTVHNSRYKKRKTDWETRIWNIKWKLQKTKYKVPAPKLLFPGATS